MAVEPRTFLQKEGRRIGVVTTLAFASGIISYLRIDVQHVGIPLPIIAGIIYALVIAPVTAATLFFMPSLSDLVEYFALSRLSVSFFSFAVPDQGIIILTSPLLAATLVATGGIASSRILSSEVKPVIAGLFAGLGARFADDGESRKMDALELKPSRWLSCSSGPFLTISKPGTFKLQQKGRPEGAAFWQTELLAQSSSSSSEAGSSDCSAGASSLVPSWSSSSSSAAPISSKSSAISISA